MSEMHTTQSAARLLGVSEASVRRWSDAGLLPVRRVGRRRVRRFAEEDILRFQGSDQTGAGPVARKRAPLALHDHFATFYDSDPGRMRLSLPFLRDGLLAGEGCFLVASTGLVEGYLRALDEEPGVDTTAAVTSGALVIRSGVGSSAKEAVSGWEQLWWRALGSGAKAVRVVGEMATYEGFSEVGEMLDYEVAYDSLSRRMPVMTLCQYDVRAFDGVAIMGALRAHPDMFARRMADFLF